jgi:hypothetical protein
LRGFAAFVGRLRFRRTPPAKSDIDRAGFKILRQEAGKLIENFRFELNVENLPGIVIMEMGVLG